MPRSPESPLELTLYISPASPASFRAVANIQRILRPYRSKRLRFSICDVSVQPDAAERDHVTFTPTLCKRAPGTPLWILGDLAHPEPLVGLLEMHGVKRTHGHREAHHGRPRSRHPHARRHS